MLNNMFNIGNNMRNDINFGISQKKEQIKMPSTNETTEKAVEYTSINNTNYICCNASLNSSNFNMNNVPNRMTMNKGYNLFSNDKQLLNINFQDLATYLNYISKTNPSLKSIKTSNFLDGMLLNADMFDKRGNKGPNNYTVQGLRGGKIYEGPIGWIGYGLSVLNKYDRGNNIWLGNTGTKPGEWCVAYHGTNLEFAKSILINNFKAGPGQTYSCDDDKNHPGQKVCAGVYVAPNIKMAEIYGRPFNGYKCVFMCRVNPKYLRIPKSRIDSWVVSGESYDIRPYRLLIKYEDSSSHY